MVVDLILPSSKIKQYAKLVIGLLLILIILQPILSIFKVDVEQLISPVFQTSTNSNLEAEIENQTNQKKNEIESINRAYVLQEMVVQMKNLVEEELNQDYQSAIDHLEVEWKEEETAETTEDITAIYVQLKPFQEGNLETVEKVEINIGESEKELDNESFDNQEIIDFFSRTMAGRGRYYSCEMEGGIRWLNGGKKILSSLKISDKKPNKIHYIVLIGLIGIFILLVSNLLGSDQSSELPNYSSSLPQSESEDSKEVWKQKDANNASEKMAGIEEAYENDLVALLEKITGVSNVEVMVNLDATNEKVYQKKFNHWFTSDK